MGALDWTRAPRAAILAGALTALGACATDTLDFVGGAPEVGALVDGEKRPGAIVPVNDAGFTIVGTRIGVGELESGASNEVIAFTNDRRPEQLATPWTNGHDKFVVSFKPRTEIPVTIWIVSGPFASQRDHAMEAIVRTTQIWRDERVGLAFGAITWVDATADPEAPSVLAFPNGDQGDAIGWAPLRAAIGFTPGRVNIYWLDTVDGATTSGWSNFGAQIAMGRNSGDELLVHEIGHALSLQHIDTFANFDQTNVMYPFSNTRAYFTEGQIARAHMNAFSALRAIYVAAPPVLPLRSCGTADENNACPRIDRRLWADGAFAANN